MTIAKTTSRVAYAGNDSTTAFAYGYRFFADGDLQIYILVDSTGVQTLQTLTTHYTVSNNGDETGGTVTMLSAPATGETLTLLRAVPITQSTDYATNDAFPAESHEQALDRLTLQGQEVSERTDRALVGQSSDGDMAALPSIVDRVSSYFGWDSSGDPVVLSAPTDTSITTVWSRDLLDDGNAFSGRDTLLVSDKVLVKSANYTLTAADRGKVIVFTATATLSLLTAASAQDGYSCTIIVEGGILTIDPNGAETCNGVATSKMYPGEEGKLFTDATEWRVGGLGSGPVVIENLSLSGMTSDVEFVAFNSDRFSSYSYRFNGVNALAGSLILGSRYSINAGSSWISTSNHTSLANKTFSDGTTHGNTATGRVANDRMYPLEFANPIYLADIGINGGLDLFEPHTSGPTVMKGSFSARIGNDWVNISSTCYLSTSDVVNGVSFFNSLTPLNYLNDGSITMLGHP